MPAAIIFNLLVLHLLLTLPHELGHFVAARVQGVQVPEFGIGLPPTVAAVRWRGTRWSLNLIPIGSFVGY
ncbi:MAG TPA: site-2 protease family protein, partial [Chloroflexota bacterium]|nr:site-2 protease family protein [Chloroflexota bacterium]